MTAQEIPSQRPLRLLVVDFTAAGDGTATGELKSAIFSGLGDLPIMQVCATGDILEYTFPNDQPDIVRPAVLEDLLAQLDWFAPTLILARPTADRDALWLLALALRARYDAPLLVWIMDDWLSVMADGPHRDAYNRSLEGVFALAGRGLSICDEMSEAFSSRFGVPFTAIANGIDPDGEFARFEPRSHGPEEPFVFRYAGALAHNMGVVTLERVAHAVRRLRRDGLDVCLEIKTRGYWLQQEGGRFSGLDGVFVSESAMARYPYLTWLSEADCNLICYNFDDASRRYVRYSLANKLPELLGVCAPVLGIGPADLPTIARLRELGAGFQLSNPDPEAIERCLRDLVVNRDRLPAVAKRGRSIAETAFNLDGVRGRFREALEQAMAAHKPLGEDGVAATLAAAQGFAPGRLPIDLATLAERVPPVPLPARIETPERLRQSYQRDPGSRDDPAPPRPTREGFGDDPSPTPMTSEPGETPSDVATPQPAPRPSSPALPLVLERPDGWQRPWLAAKAEAALAFSKASKARVRNDVVVPQPSQETLADEAFLPAPKAWIEALNGARLLGGGQGDQAFIIERQGAPSAEHAAIHTNLDHPVKGMRIDVLAVRGVVEVSASGEVLASVQRTGIYDVMFRRPRFLGRISIRCRDSQQARFSVRRIGYLAPKQRA